MKYALLFVALFLVLFAAGAPQTAATATIPACNIAPFGETDQWMFPGYLWGYFVYDSNPINIESVKVYWYEEFSYEYLDYILVSEEDPLPYYYYEGDSYNSPTTVYRHEEYNDNWNQFFFGIQFHGYGSNFMGHIYKTVWTMTYPGHPQEPCIVEVCFGPDTYAPGYCPDIE